MKLDEDVPTSVKYQEGGALWRHFHERRRSNAVFLALASATGLGLLSSDALVGPRVYLGYGLSGIYLALVLWTISEHVVLGRRMRSLNQFLGEHETTISDLPRGTRDHSLVPFTFRGFLEVAIFGSFLVLWSIVVLDYKARYEHWVASRPSSSSVTAQSPADSSLYQSPLPEPSGGGVSPNAK